MYNLKFISITKSVIRKYRYFYVSGDDKQFGVNPFIEIYTHFMEFTTLRKRHKSSLIVYYHG